MPWRPSASAHVRASAICPTAAAACESSSLSGPPGSFSTARPSAIAPDDTTRISRFSPCSRAMSSASEASHVSLTRPAAASTSRDEPTLTTMRRKSVSAGVFRDMGCGLSGRPCLISEPRWQLRMPRLGGLGALDAIPVDHLDEPAQHLGHADMRGGGNNQRRFLGGALEPRDLLLELLGRERVRLAERHDLRLVGQAVTVSFKLVAHGLVILAGMLAGAVDEMQQHAAALHMTEEAITQPDTLMRVLDQPGKIGEHEL